MNKEELNDYLEIFYYMLLEVQESYRVIGFTNFKDKNFEICNKNNDEEKSIFEVTNKLTNEFYRIHKDTIWDKNENTLFFDTLEKFIDENL